VCHTVICNSSTNYMYLLDRERSAPGFTRAFFYLFSYFCAAARLLDMPPGQPLQLSFSIGKYAWATA
jgi:hypothetical protein